MSDNMIEWRNQARERFQPLSEDFLKLYKMEEESGGAPDEVWHALADIDWFGCIVPKKYGGNEAGLFKMATTFESVCSTGVVSFLPCLTALSTAAVVRAGSHELKDKILPSILRGKTKICFSATEKNAGFNIFNIETHSNKNDEGYILNGSKTYATAFDVADYAMVVTRSLSADQREKMKLPKTAGISVYLVNTKSQGITKKMMNTRGEGAARQFDVQFSNCQVPTENLVGKEHEGALVLFTAFNLERILFCSGILGVAEFCLQQATEYAKQRSVFGEAVIGSYQAVQHPLADVKIRLDVLRNQVYHVAKTIDAGANPAEVVSLCSGIKYLASELLDKAVNAAVGAMGGQAFHEENGIIQLFELSKLLHLSPISNAMVLNEIAEKVLKLPKSY
jgi:acyl-CoA dehydrogenase